MRQGFRVIDSDTHVNPSFDVLLRYADQTFRDQMDDLKPYMRTVKPRPGQGDAEDQDSYTILSVKPLRLQRVAGEKLAPAKEQSGDRGFLSGRTQMVTRKPLTPASRRITHGRLRIWTPKAGISTSSSRGPGPMALPPGQPLTRGLVRAYHRYMADYCAADARRHKYDSGPGH